MKFDLISRVNKKIEDTLTNILKEKYDKNLMDKETISKMRADIKPSSNWETTYYYGDTAILKISLANRHDEEMNKLVFTLEMEHL